MRPERGGAPARLHSGRARLFPPLCFKLRAEPFNFTLLPPPFFFLIFFLAGEEKRGWCFPLSRVTLLASSAFSLQWRPEKDGPGSRRSVVGSKPAPPASPVKRPRPSPANGHGAAPPPSVCSRHKNSNLDLRIQNRQETPKMLTRKIKLWDINAHITCRLCNGYLIDATTVTECLHTFCRSCLVKYLEENNTCPTCRIVIHQSHPLQYIGHDRTMQDIVYKLVPGLQEAEMKKQREFYHKLGMEVPGDIKGETCSTKQHLDSHRNGETKTDENSNKETSEEKQEEDNDYHRSDEQLDILCNEEILGKDHTLKFVVVTRWRFKKAPLLLHYRPKMDLL
ncbi:polycomb group RING finger protein 3 isoform X2 [Buteo buteo]|uniref:polycomb group RING finger protein 3 isoform X2 n=2 Tax=Accipitrinae TaxID=8955 RepID=UPI003EBF8C9C